MKPSAFASVTLIRHSERSNVAEYWPDSFREAFQIPQSSSAPENNCTVTFLLNQYTPIWIKIPCHEKIGHAKIICQYNISPKVPRVIINQRLSLECPTPWVYIKGRCYSIFTYLQRTTTYQNTGRALCEKSGSNIADLKHLNYLMYNFPALIGKAVIYLLVKVSSTLSSPCVLVPSDIETRHDRALLHSDCTSLAKLSHGVICETGADAIAWGTCPKGLYRCRDNSCILEKYVCDGRSQCPDNSDESNCTEVCTFSNGTVSTQVMFCFTTCRQPFCDCSWNYYQCIEGGCVAWWAVCDCTNDCMDGSDEAQCASCQSAISETMPLHASYNLTELTNANKDISAKDTDVFSFQRNLNCAAHGLGTCDDDFNQCFPRGGLCIYERTPSNEVEFCANGAHLLNCYMFDCPSFFKCDYSYCIPLHRVCNGQVDCPGGEDEAFCEYEMCIGLLKCGKEGYCVHPNNLQDGRVQCVDTAEDEDIYISQPCPKNCVCRGPSLGCSNLNPVIAPAFHKVKKLYLRAARFEYTKHVFSVFRDLLSLDISENKLSKLYIELFAQQRKLIDLNLEINHLRHIQQFHFSGLYNLRHLNLKGNPIQTIDSLSYVDISRATYLDLSRLQLHQVQGRAFTGMHYCTFLNLSFNNISEILSDTFTGMPKLMVLDLRLNPIMGFSPKEFHNIRMLSVIYMPREEYCCEGNFTGSCTPSGVSFSCSIYIQTPVIKPIGWCIILVMVLSNGMLLFSNIRKRSGKLFIPNVLMSTLGLLMVLSLVLLLIMDLSFQGSYVARHERTLLLSPACLVSSFLYITSFEMIPLTATLSTVFKCVAVIRPLQVRITLPPWVIRLTCTACLSYVIGLAFLTLSGDNKSVFRALGPSCSIIVPNTDNISIGYAIVLCTNAMMTLVIVCTSLVTIQSLLTNSSTLPLQRKSNSSFKHKAVWRVLVSMLNNCVGMLILFTLNILTFGGFVLTRETQIIMTIVAMPTSMLMGQVFEAVTMLIKLIR